MRMAFALLALFTIAGATAAADPPVPAPSPSPSPAERPATRPLSLDLDKLFDLQRERGHAEFDTSLRQVWWNDPMVRLSFGVAREEAAARRGGLVGYPAPFSATAMMSRPPGPDLRLVLTGPFASDWHDLSTQEKFGRIAEGAAYYGLIYGILRALH
jgi:hypothetical protein